MKLKLHHINLVSKNLDELNNFYVNILGLTQMSENNFVRTSASEQDGYAGKINFATDGNFQLHLAEKDLNVSAKNKMFLNPVEKGHIAFRIDDIEKIKKILKKNKINFADYGTKFSQEWYQIFFYDPEGNIIEVHQEISK